MGIVITVLMGIWAAVMFIAAENKEKIWEVKIMMPNIVRKKARNP